MNKTSPGALSAVAKQGTVLRQVPALPGAGCRRQDRHLRSQRPAEMPPRRLGLVGEAVIAFHPI